MQPLVAPKRYHDTSGQRLHSAHPAPRRDPAPSRGSYRLQRLLLSRSMQILLRLGLPIFVVVLPIAIYFSDTARRTQIVTVVQEMKEVIEGRPEYQVTLMSIDGAPQALTDGVRRALSLELPISSFDLDLAALRAQIGNLDAVARADLRIKAGVLHVVIVERAPALVWRLEDGLQLLDATGRRVALLRTRNDRVDLPLIAGLGANLAAPEALELLAAAGPITPRLRGLVRVGERRWDMVLDRGQRILLPQHEPKKALERLIALDQAQRLLARDVPVIDLRITARPVLKLSPQALDLLRRENDGHMLETQL
jgi:cell division protein FtsQ